MGRRVDTHVHVLPDDYRAALQRRADAPVRLPPWSRESLDGLLARNEIDAAVLSLSPPGVWFGDQGFANELARMVNERTAELVRSAPSRFAGLAFLPLPDVSRAIEELSYALDVLELDGVSLLSNVAGVYHGDPVWDPLWAELERRGAYVMLHPNAPPHALPLAQHPIWPDLLRHAGAFTVGSSAGRAPGGHGQLPRAPDRVARDARAREGSARAWWGFVGSRRSLLRHGTV
jgi:predicted TIM-barrel fold metal-dependent hydrolase